jgi:hypothetical protein
VRTFIIIHIPLNVICLWLGEDAILLNIESIFSCYNPLTITSLDAGKVERSDNQKKRSLLPGFSLSCEMLVLLSDGAWIRATDNTTEKLTKVFSRKTILPLKPILLTDYCLCPRNLSVYRYQYQKLH